MIHTCKISYIYKLWSTQSEKGVFYHHTTVEACIREIHKAIRNKGDTEDTYSITIEPPNLGPVKEYAVEGFDYNFRYNGGCLSFPVDNACGRTRQEALEDLYVRVASQSKCYTVMDRFYLTVETPSHRFSMNKRPIKETP